METGLTEAEKWAADTGQLVDECQLLLGRELTAYLGGVDDPAGLTRVLDLADPVARPARDRLEATMMIIRTFSESRVHQARAWLRGINRALRNRAPASVIRCSASRADRELVYRQALAAVTAAR